MSFTVEQLKEFLKDIPDDYKLFIFDDNFIDKKVVNNISINKVESSVIFDHHYIHRTERLKEHVDMPEK